MTEINNIAVEEGVTSPKFSIEGRTGNNLALAQYLAQLEQSPFIRNVRLRDSQLVREEDKLVYSFLLEADYEAPPPDVIETVPLFTPGTEPDSANTTPQQGTTAPQRGSPPGRAGAPERTPGTQEQR
jgi:hypothetical protein